MNTPVDHVTIDGIVCYSPDRAEAHDSYPAEGFDVTAKIEQVSFWCRSRNRLIRMLLERGVPPPRQIRMLDVGCGTGNVLEALRSRGGIQLTGSEIYLSGLRHAKRRYPDMTFIQMDATAMPFEAQFDVVGAFDVIEHIEDDRLALANIHRALVPGGLLIASVPQYPWLWSRLDEIVHHQRRYTRRDLIEKVVGAGLQPVLVTSFVTVLFPLMLLSRLFGRRRGDLLDAHETFASEVHLPPLVNRLFDAVMRIDETLVRLGLSLPFGGSLVIVATRSRPAR